MSSSACDWAIDMSSIASARLCRKAGQSGRGLADRSRISCLDCCAFARLSRARSPTIWSFCLISNLGLALARGELVDERPRLVADGDQRIELLAQSGHQSKHDLLLAGQLFEHPGALQVFLVRARGGGGGILHLAIKRRQQGVGLLEVSRHAAPG